MGICVNEGRCLQQWAKAAMWAGVAWVRRMMDNEATCLYPRPSVNSTYTANDFGGYALSVMTFWLNLFVYIEYKYWYCVTRWHQSAGWLRVQIPLQATYLSRPFSFATSKSASHPTSMRTLTPPSNSNRDWDAGDVDWAPKRGVNWNMFSGLSFRWIPAFTSYPQSLVWVLSYRFGIRRRWWSRNAVGGMEELK